MVVEPIPGSEHAADATPTVMEQAPSKRVAVIMAHPDDAEFSCAGTVAKWAAEGHEVTYVVMTSGDKGSDDPAMTADRLREVREAEQRAAGDILGVKDIIFMRQPDGMLVADLTLRRELVRVIRRLKPDIVITGDPTVRWESPGYINHPDHVAAAEATLAAIFPAARNRMYFPELLAEGLEPHRVEEVYLLAWGTGDVWIDITDVMDRKIAALRAHASQVGHWDFEPMIRTWAKETAARHEGAGEYAEAFRYFKLD